MGTLPSQGDAPLAGERSPRRETQAPPGLLTVQRRRSILATVKRVFLAGAIRTPIGKFGGSLRSLTAADLGVVVTRAALGRARISPADIEETFFGCARQAGVGPNVARQIAFRAKIPVDRPATTINLACASSLQSLIEAARAIRAGDREALLVGGTESMSNVPHFVFGARWGIPLGKSALVDAMYHDGFHCKLCDLLMGATADKVAREYSISRAEQDEYALLSQERTARAINDGLFKNEIAPVTVKTRGQEQIIDTDEHPRPDTTLESLAKLAPVFADDGTVTAGNACGITDGAAAMIVLSEEALRRLSVKPDAELLGYFQSGVAPEVMGLSPVPATQGLLARQKMTLADIDLIELNEAFAGQALAVLRDLECDTSRVNIHGGAIALGHPIGATGARILTTLIHALKTYDKSLGLATLCVSGGQGVSVLIRRVEG